MSINKDQKNNSYCKKITYSNELARSVSFYTLEEEKLLHIVLGKLKPNIKNPLVFSFPKQEIFEKLNLTGDDKYDRYAEIFKGLAHKTYAQLTDINGKISAGVLIYHSEWGKKVSYVNIHLNPNFMHHLEQLISQYTSVQEKSILSLNTKNAVTTYQYLVSWMDKKKSKNEVFVDLPRLKVMYCLKESDYVYEGKFHNILFEKRTIAKYVKDINENTELNVQYTKNKVKNRIINYKFSVENKSQNQLNDKLLINDLNKTKNQIKIKEIVGNYLQLTKKGQNYLAICPFHKDTKESLCVSEEKNIFKCFSCGCSGDAINFITKYENISFHDTLIKLEKLTNIKIRINAKNDDKKCDVFFQINKIACDSYFHYLNCSNKAKEWLIKERSLTEDLISFFKIGYSGNDLYSLQEVYLSWNIAKPKEKISFFEIEKLGIIKQQTEEKYLNFFQNRIMFPIFNVNNNIVGFLGRSINENLEIKYLNSLESEIFKKSECLYNIQNLKKDNPVYVYEGVFDLISSHKIGFTNGVAVMGSSLSNLNLKELSKYNKKIIFCFDNDETGHKNTMTSANQAIALKMRPYVVVFSSKYKDIDSFINEDEKEAKKSLENPVPFREWQTNL